MNRQLLLAFLLLSVTLVAGHFNHDNCIHDKILEKFKPSVEPHMEGRMLLNGIEDEKKPFRVKFDTSPLTDSVGTKEQRDFIKNDLLPLAAQFFNTRFRIRRRTAPIKLPYDTCYEAPVPEKDRTVGVSDADLIIYVTAAAAQESFTAWATSCMTDSVNGRAIAGQVNYNLNYLGLNPEAFEANLGTTLHEITHVLGFSSWGFTQFIDPDTGKARPKDQLVEAVTMRGFATTILKTPKVVELAKKHFGCSTIRGVEMENQGGGGSLGSHFERTILMNEAMTASRIQNRAYSKFTMAVLEDSGWYYPNYDLSDEFFFGEGAGCNMFEKGCQADPRPREYCFNDQNDYCTLDYYAKGYCSSEGFSDNCNYVGGYSNGDCREVKNGGSVYAGEKLGLTSKCLIGTLIASNYRANSAEGARCLEYKCLNGQVTLTAANGKSATCKQDGEKLTIEGYSGYVNCPPAKYFCETYYEACPNYCSGKGKCVEGKCQCRPGRTGADCSQLSGCASDCNSNGVCQSDATCLCNAGWTGATCDTKSTTDPCLNVNCGSNGVCRNGECVCNSGFTGKSCSEVVNPCQGVNCGNGVCNSGKCVCNSGWTGTNCNQQINPCAGINCNNGVCNAGSCLCNAGWTGSRCETKIDPCAGKKCGNGSCKDGACVCQPGWKGADCTTYDCNAQNCVNGTCEVDRCRCNSGWTGLRCSEQVIDPCASVVCQNGGKCSGGNCLCNTGFSGARCEKIAAAPKACPNNCSGKGRCLANGKCSCQYPAYGDDCSTSYEQGCVDNSCSGNGICYKKKCYCSSGFNGDKCEIKNV